MASAIEFAARPSPKYGGASLRRWRELRREWHDSQRHLRAIFPGLDLVLFLIPHGEDHVHFVFGSADPAQNIEDTRIMSNAAWAANRDLWKELYYELPVREKTGLEALFGSLSSRFPMFSRPRARKKVPAVREELERVYGCTIGDAELAGYAYTFLLDAAEALEEDDTGLLLREILSSLSRMERGPLSN